MKVFLDQSVPHRGASLLREAGVSAVHAFEVGLSSADDADILDGASPTRRSPLRSTPISMRGSPCPIEEKRGLTQGGISHCLA